MCDKSEILGVLSSDAVNNTIRSLVEETITNSDQTKEALYKKGCGLMKKVFEDNKKEYSDKISKILEEYIPKLFKDNTDFKTSLTSTLVDIMKSLNYKGYIVEVKEKTTTPPLVGERSGGSKTLHNKTFKKPRKGNKRKKQNK